MLQNRVVKSLLLLLGIAALLYVAVSLFVASSRRLTFGIDRQSGEIRLAESEVTYLPLHRYRRISFAKRNGGAQTAGIANTRSKENIPIRIAYRVRFLLTGARLPNHRQIVVDGWDPWFNARIGEAVRGFTAAISVEELIAPTSRNNEIREKLREAVGAHLGRSGIEVTAFEIESLSIDREALLAHKRQELRRRARSQSGSVVVIGIDGADWGLLDSLVASGRMPNLASILRRGAKAEVHSIHPLVTPLVWASLSTGTPPSRHGIVDYFETRGQAPVSARSRNAPALWEIAPSFGRASTVVDWWTAWPPLRDGAAIVMPGDRLSGLETRLADRVESLVVPAETIGYPQISRFVDLSEADLEAALASGDPKNPIVILRDTLARTWTDHRIGLELYQSRQPALLLLGVPGADVIHHVFGPFHPPFRSGVDRESYDRYWPVVTNFYIELDRLLGEWLLVLPEDATLVIVSAHGHRWDSRRPRDFPLDRADLSSHRDSCVFITAGRRVDPSRSMRRIDLLDVTPTLLTLLGLPVAEEMQGAPTSELFAGLNEVGSVEITSYSDVIELDRWSAIRSNQSPESYRAELNLVGHLGTRSEHTGRPSSVEPEQDSDWGRYAWLNNEGTRLAKRAELESATSRLLDAIELEPDRHVSYLNLAMVALDAGQFPEAERLVWKAIETGAPEPEGLLVDLAAWYRKRGHPERAVELLEESRQRYPDSFAVTSNLGSALAAAGRLDEAIPVLEQALGMRPTSTRVLNNLGELYATRQDYSRALEFWNRSLEIAPRQPAIAEAARAAIGRL